MPRAGWVVLIVIAVLVLIVIAIPFFISANDFRPTLESKLSQAAGRQVKVGNLSLSIFSGGISADDLSVADDPAFSSSPFLRAKSLKIGVRLMPLIFSHQLNITDLTSDQPPAALIENPSGRWNISSLGSTAKDAAPSPSARKPASKQPTPAEPQSTGSAEPLTLSAQLVKVADGRFSIGSTNAKTKPEVFEHVNLELRDVAVDRAFPFSLSAQVVGGGDIHVQGNAGPLNTSDLVMTPVTSSFNVNHLDLDASGFVQPSTGIAGIVSVNGTTSSNGQEVQAKAHLTADRWKLAVGGTPVNKPLTVDASTNYDLARRTGTITSGDVRVGNDTVKLGGTYNLAGDVPSVNMNASGTNLPLTDLATALSALDIVLPAGSSIQGGTLTAHFQMQGPADRLITTGPVRIDNARLAGFSLLSKISDVARLGGAQTSTGQNTEIQTASTNVRSAPDGTALSDIKIVAPSIADLSGSGTISPQHVLNFQMTVTLAGGSGSLLAAVGRQSNLKIPF